jgi:hypothetical protein
MTHRGETLTAIEAAALRSLVERIGEKQARAVLQVSAQTLARAIGLMHVQRATATHIRARLAGIREAA